MTLRLFVALILIGAWDPASAQTPSDGRPLLDCAEFAKATDEAALAKRFGRANVVAAKLDGAEGQTVSGTAIYPKDAARRLEIYWQDEARRRGLASIAIRGKSEWMIRVPGKDRTEIGLKTSLDELEQANERPFLINGFGWDYGGFGAGWKGGRLDRLPGGCSIGVRFDPDSKIQGKALDRVSGDKRIGSSEPALRAVKPALSSLTLDWPE